MFTVPDTSKACKCSDVKKVHLASSFVRATSVGRALTRQGLKSK